MKIGFLEPAFLSALVLVTIPIIVHLFNFRKFKVVYFTNVSFLKELKEETNSKSKLKHMLVLASRILAVIFLVLAFAQPVIPTVVGKKAYSGNLVSIYIDNSFSMEALGAKGTRLEEATIIARDIANSYRPSDRFQLLTTDFDAAYQRLLTREEFLSALESIEPSSSTITVSEVYSRQKDILTNAGSGNKLAIQISDFQTSVTDLSNLKPDSTINALLIPIASSVSDNVSIDSCWLSTPVVQAGQLLEIGVRVRNHGETEISSIPLKFVANGVSKAAATVDVPEGGFTDVNLSITPNDTGWYECLVSLEDNAVLFDDKYHFSFRVESEVPVTAINGIAAGSYFKSLFPQDGYFKLREFSEKQVDFGTMTNSRVVILNEVKSITSGMISELNKFVKNGGVLVIIPDSLADITSYKSLANSLGSGCISSIVRSQDRVDKLQTDDPVFSGVFSNKGGINSSTDLPNVNSRFLLEGGVPEVILKLRSGDGYLNRYRSGNGSVYLLGSSLSGNMSGLARHAIFVPVFYRIALLSNNPQVTALAIGMDAYLDLPASSFFGERVFRLKGGAQGLEYIPTHRSTGSNVRVGFGNAVKEAGTYDLNLDGRIISKPSFNYNRAESVMSFFEPSGLKDQIDELRLTNFKVDASLGASAMSGTTDTTGFPLWKYCIMLALLFLFTEVLLLKFWKT
ncbi:MAG: BatA domain-containing protein [Bacteroidota bacterium]